MASELGKQLTGEFIGTYLLILTVGFNILSGQSTWAVLSIASVLMVSIYSLASVSGANFNPAVTLALYLTGTEPDVTKVGAQHPLSLVNYGAEPWMALAKEHAVGAAVGLLCSALFYGIFLVTVLVGPESAQRSGAAGGGSEASSEASSSTGGPKQSSKGKRSKKARKGQ